MSFLLDTCVLSDGARQADAGLVAWLGATPNAACFISVITLGEIQKGVALMDPDHPRRAALATWLDQELPRGYAGRILPVSAEVAVAWGQLTADGQRSGSPLPDIDGLLLATAATHRLTIVTRNTKHVAGRGVPVIDPWTGVKP